MGKEREPFRPYCDCTTKADIESYWEIFHDHGGPMHQDVHLTQEEWCAITGLVEGLMLDAADLSIECRMYREEMDYRNLPWWKRLAVRLGVSRYDPLHPLHTE